MSAKIIIMLAGAASLLTGCASTRNQDVPIGVSSSINGLRQSRCNCGGVESKKQEKKRKGAVLPAPSPDTGYPPAAATSGNEE